MISHFDTIAYNNQLRKVRPEQKVFFAFLLLLIAMLGSWKAQLIMIFWLGIWIIGYAGVSWKVYAKTLVLMSVFLMISWPLLIISIDHSFQISVDSARISMGIALSLRSMAAWSCLFFLLVTTPFPEFLYVLKKIRVPLVIIELLFFTYRFVFVLERAAEELYTAMKARNGGNHWRHGGMLIFQLFQKVWCSYNALLLTLRARGFSDELVYIHMETYSVGNKRYFVEAVIGVVLLLWLG